MSKNKIFKTYNSHLVSEQVNKRDDYKEIDGNRQRNR